jgi:hypothetical protein
MDHEPVKAIDGSQDEMPMLVCGQNLGSSNTVAKGTTGSQPYCPAATRIPTIRARKPLHLKNALLICFVACSTADLTCVRVHDKKWKVSGLEASTSRNRSYPEDRVLDVNASLVAPGPTVDTRAHNIQV